MRLFLKNIFQTFFYEMLLNCEFLLIKNNNIEDKIEASIGYNNKILVTFIIDN